MNLIKMLLLNDPHMPKSFFEQYKALTPEMLAQFALDEDPEVRCVVAYHANTSRETLALLLNDENPEVRELAAYNIEPLEDVPF